MSDISEKKLGALVTNKWLVGTLVGLCMSMGGYIFNGIDRTTDATALTLSDLRVRMGALEVKQGRSEAQYEEIIRRFDRLDNAVSRLEHR